MNRSFSNVWSKLLNIGGSPMMSHLQQMRLHVINGLVIIGAAATLLYVGIFTAIGASGAIEGLAVMPVLAVVLFLNYERHYSAARLVTIHVTQLVVFALAVSDRRTGTEYVLLVLAISSIIVFERWITMIIGFVSCCLYYLLYVVLDNSMPFEPTADTPYLLVNNALIFLCGIWVASLLLLFRSTTFKYAGDLREAVGEIAAMNQVLQSSNQQLYARTEDLDLAVRRKTIDLQVHKRAIDEHLMSITTDKRGRILSVNKKCLDVLGYRMDEIVGKDIQDLHTEFNEALIAEMVLALNAGAPYRSEVKTKTAGKSDVWVDMLAIPVESPDGSHEYFLYLSIPISARKALEIVHARALVGLEAIAHRTSHEIRGPLARILGLSQLLERGLISSDELPDIAQKMVISANELNAATSALTEFIHEHERELGDALN
ncbi:PAS domain S-box protein [Chryseolinea sp. T2]|uniref:PAS domain S-box protein n=1 Tax=Chryseolinea sp. T2 TaxID=3129255 RepID=UPI003077F6C2